MFKQPDQGIVAGENAVNAQAGRDVYQQITIGISEERAREIGHEIAVRVSRELVETALATFQDRASELIRRALERLAREVPEARNTFSDPDMQFTLGAAQQEFGRSGSEDLGVILVELIVRRARHDREPRPRIVLNQAIKTAGLLTANDYDVLAVLFLFRHLTVVPDLDSMRARLVSGANMLAGADSSDNVFRHLVYAGCILRDETTNNFGSFFETQILNNGGRRFLQRGMTQEHAVRNKLPADLLESHPFAAGLVQLRFRMPREVDTIGDSQLRGVVGQLMQEQTFPLNEIAQQLETWAPGSAELGRRWNLSALPMFSLTSVGIAIALSQLKARYGMESNLAEFVS